MSSLLKPFTTRVRTNIDDVLQMTQMIDGIMMTGDSRANQIIVELYGKEGHVNIPSGTKIVGYFIRGDDYTVEVEGEVNEYGEAVVVIPKAAYYVTGALSIAIRMLDDQVTVIDPDTGDEIIDWRTKIVIAALSCFVQNTETDSIIDPDHHIPDVQELLAYIDRLSHQYTLIAEAESLRVEAEEDRVEAEEQREEDTQDAITAMGNATTTMQNAVQAVIDKIDDMTVSATNVGYEGNPTVTISEVSGHKHIAFGLKSGQPFRIKRTFSSVAEMEAYSGSDVQVGDMVIIASTVETPDNAKLYVKTANGWSFIVDLSGATGIQGPKGDTGDKGDTGTSIDHVLMNSDYTLTIYLENGTSYTTPYSIRGAKGEPGAGGYNFTYTDGSGLLSIEFY